MAITRYKCDNCLAELAFNPATQRWDCEYCKSSFTLEELSAIEQSFEENVDGIQAKPAEESNAQDGMVVYQCSNCGAEILADKETSATFCLYCKHPTIIPQQFKGDFRPQYVIPFAITKEEAIAKFEKMIQKKRFISKNFKDKKTISEVKGIYVPFWLYNIHTKGNTNYDCQNIRTSRHGNTEITKTDYYAAYREMEVHFNQIPVDASEKMDDSLMTSIEPFDYSRLMQFSPSYLAGFFSEKYTADKKDAERRVQERAKNSFFECMDKTCNYSITRRVNQVVNYEKIENEYALLPVYIITIKYKNKPYIYAINGQSGKVAGNIPIHFPKVVLYGAGIYFCISFLTQLLIMFAN